MLMYMDADNDGELDLDELKKGLKELGSPMSDEEIGVLFKKADKKWNGKIDAVEFITVAQKAREQEDKGLVLLGLS